MNNYYINCDLGDTIYSLLIVKTLGGGGFYYGPSHPSATTSHKVKNKLLEDLLYNQEYIYSFGYTDKMFWRDLHNDRIAIKEERVLPKKIFFDKKNIFERNIINKIPNLFWTPSGPEMLYMPLIYSISERFSVDKHLYKEPWIEVPNKYMHDKKIIINRTSRYNNDLQFYVDIINKNEAKNCGFIGTEKEYNSFIEQTSLKIDHVITKDLLEAAIAIKNSRIFVGNQSSCMALAEALKHTTFQEVSLSVPNCLFTHRNNFYGVVCGKQIGFPEEKYVCFGNEDFEGCGIKVFLDTWYDTPPAFTINNNRYQIRSIEI
jgi:hypothetical protein